MSSGDSRSMRAGELRALLRQVDRPSAAPGPAVPGLLDPPLDLPIHDRRQVVAALPALSATVEDRHAFGGPLGDPQRRDAEGGRQLRAGEEQRSRRIRAR